jgi:hypothetical protein
MLQGPATFVLAILGCGEGEARCQQVALAPVRYESQAACLAASEDALASADAPFPVLVADCRRAGTQVAVRADEVRLPEPRRPIRTASARR